MWSTTARPVAAVVEGTSAVKTSAATNAAAARLRKNPARLKLGQPVLIESTGRSAFALCALYNHYLADFAPERSNRQAAIPPFRQWRESSAQLAKKRGAIAASIKASGSGFVG